MFSENFIIDTPVEIDPDLFTYIDEERAYLLGWIASNAHVTTAKCTIVVQLTDQHIIPTLKKIIGADVTVTFSKLGDQDFLLLGLVSAEVCAAIANRFECALNNGVLDRSEIRFPVLPNTGLRWAFIRGMFDANGYMKLHDDGNRMSTNILSLSAPLLEALHRASDLPGDVKEGRVEWLGLNTVDFLHGIYGASRVHLESKYQKYVQIINWRPAVNKIPAFRYQRVDARAVAPTKVRGTDSGYDLWLVELIREEAGVRYYSTGLRVQPDTGYYFELVGRSSISKSGHMLANNIGIIDASYTGPVIAALRKVDATAPDLVLPARLVQLIPRQRVHLAAVEGDVETTQRSVGGFGSTGV